MKAVFSEHFTIVAKGSAQMDAPRTIGSQMTVLLLMVLVCTPSIFVHSINISLFLGSLQ